MLLTYEFTDIITIAKDSSVPETTKRPKRMFRRKSYMSARFANNSGLRESSVCFEWQTRPIYSVACRI